MLTVQLVTALGGAAYDLRVLNSKTIVEKDDDAKRTALRSFVAKTMTEHVDEFVTAWFALENEYRPLLRSVATLLEHSTAILARKQEIIAAQQKAQQPVETNPSGCGEEGGCSAGEPGPDNVVPFPRAEK